MVRRWRSWFLEGRQSVHDDERSGSPVTATDNAAVAAVRNVVEADRRVTIDEIMIRLPPGIEIRRSSIGTIMSDVLNFLKVCTRWVQRMEAARAFLEMHQRDGDQLFSSIVTGDESWVHHSTPETKRQSMVWKKPEESAPKKAKVTISAGKVMAMENFKWEIFTHPPYSPELAPSDFHLYPALKWHLGGKHFANDDEVQAEVNHWLRRQDTAWYNCVRSSDADRQIIVCKDRSENTLQTYKLNTVAYGLAMASFLAIRTIWQLAHDERSNYQRAAPGIHGRNLCWRCHHRTVHVTTKRETLSFVAMLYDPLGWLAPVIIRGKIMIQRLWITGLKWNEPIDESLNEMCGDSVKRLHS
ncbi:hypothetical protein LAZ67_2003830 [Cordylochernes scorpioides]|uniref:Transposase n=1 Tax=Cordylochernes scorpioides TaxID=51811 RepID=A0ABY6K4Y7_9ARAC|nr:hypothetical protein LAZ67_2003830 [Cordylochernes scorpioides]